MANAKIINYGQPIGAGTTVIPDNQVALEIESTDAKEYIEINTSDSAPTIVLGKDGAKVGIGDPAPAALLGVRANASSGDWLSVRDNAGSPSKVFVVSTANGDDGIAIVYKDGLASHKLDSGAGVVFNEEGRANTDFRVESDSQTHMLFVDGGANVVGIATTAPGQILDVNSGSGNMIADGYDTHSLARYKENVSVAGKGYLEKVKACPPKQWTRIPFVSAEEIKAAIIEEFGQSAWDLQFPEEDSHRNKALYNMPAGEMKTWVDDWADARREERRQEEKWQKVRLGLVADAADTAASFPEATAENDTGEVSGINTMSYIGTLHAALVELAARVEELENGE